MVSHRAQEIAVSLVKFGCCAILGAAGGHLGMLTLGLFTAASGSGHEAVNSGSEAVKFGSEKVVEFLAELGFESSRPSNPGLEALYTEALRLSFRHIREAAETPLSIANPDFSSWFSNWDAALSARISVDSIELLDESPAELNRRLRTALAELNAQGKAVIEARRGGILATGLFPASSQCVEPVPDELISLLQDRIPSLLPERFNDLLSNPDNVLARLELESHRFKEYKAGIASFRDEFRSTLLSAIKILKDVAVSVRTEGENSRVRDANTQSVLAAHGKKLDHILAILLRSARETDSDIAAAVPLKNIPNVINENAVEVPKVLHDLNQSTSPVATSAVSFLLACSEVRLAQAAAQSNFNAALRVKRKSDSDFAAACYDMGRVDELSFRWTTAVVNYRRAWELSNELFTVTGTAVWKGS